MLEKIPIDLQAHGATESTNNSGILKFCQKIAINTIEALKVSSPVIPIDSDLLLAPHSLLSPHTTTFCMALEK